MKQFKCPQCFVESIEEEIRFFMDQEKFEKNKIIQSEFNEATKKYIHDKKIYDDLVIKYQDIVSEYNRTKHFWQLSWKIRRYYDGLEISDSKNVTLKQYPFIILPKEPTLWLYQIHYIICPVCGYRYYFKPGGSNSI